MNPTEADSSWPDAQRRLTALRERLRADPALDLFDAIYPGYWRDVETMQERWRQETAIRNRDAVRELFRGTAVRS